MKFLVLFCLLICATLIESSSESSESSVSSGSSVSSECVAIIAAFKQLLSDFFYLIKLRIQHNADYLQLVGVYSTNALLVDTNNNFGLYMELLANLTSTLLIDISATDIMRALNGTLDPIPSPLLCILSDLSAVPYIFEETRLQLVQKIKVPIPVAVDVATTPCDQLAAWYDNVVEVDVNNMMARRKSFFQSEIAAFPKHPRIMSYYLLRKMSLESPLDIVNISSSLAPQSFTGDQNTLSAAWDCLGDRVMNTLTKYDEYRNRTLKNIDFSCENATTAIP